MPFGETWPLVRDRPLARVVQTVVDMGVWMAVAVAKRCVVRAMLLGISATRIVLSAQPLLRQDRSKIKTALYWMADE